MSKEPETKVAAEQPHDMQSIETALLTLYKHSNGKTHHEVFDPTPVEIVMRVSGKLEENFKFIVKKFANKMTDKPSDVKNIMRLAFALEFSEGNKYSQDFFGYLSKRIYLVFKQYGLFDEVEFQTLNADDHMAMYLATGTEENVFVMGLKYDSYESVVTFFQDELSESRNGKIVYKPVANAIASLLVNITSMAAANMKSRMQQKKFEERLERLKEFDMKDSLLEFLEAYDTQIKKKAA